MNAITKLTGRFLFIILLLLFVNSTNAQDAAHATSPQLKSFYSSLARLNMTFNVPEGFKEIKVVNTEAMPFEYAMEIPDADFEIWFRTNTQKDNEKFLEDKNINSSPDSVYVNIAREQAAAFTSDKNYLVRSIPPYMLDRYNANAGRTCLLNLNDSPLTKHYKYALLIVLQKDKTGTVLAICFTNVKGPEFFKNMYQASNCLKFKQ